MARLNPYTGLADVPAGHFWRIEPNRIRLIQPLPNEDRWVPSGHVYPSPPGVIVNGESEHRWVSHARSIYNLWGLFSTGHYEHRYINREIAVITHDLTPSEKPITPDILRTITHRLMDDWEKSNHARALYGDYPPKKL